MNYRALCIGLVTLVLGACSQDDPLGVRVEERPGREAVAGVVGAMHFPTVVPLPNGFQPEGIAFGNGPVFFVGSLLDGSIYSGDPRAGSGNILVPPTGLTAVGLAFDRRGNHLFAAGGPTGTGSVYDATTGATLGIYQLTMETTTFINDVVVTPTAACFTDSFRPVFYRVALGPGGELLDPPVVEEIPLGGDFVFVPNAFNANGIVASADGQHLVIVNSTTEQLYRVDALTGDARRIDLGGDSLPNGDGLLLDGLDLYVVQNRLNQIAVIRVDPSLSEGTVVDLIVDPMFDVPTTVASFGSSLYAVNARFGTPGTPDTEYSVVRVSKR